MTATCRLAALTIAALATGFAAAYLAGAAGFVWLAGDVDACVEGGGIDE